MGRAADPRVTVRLSRAEHAALDGAAVAVGVETGGLLKAAAMRGLAGAVSEIEAGTLRVRRRSVPRPVVVAVLERLGVDDPEGFVRSVASPEVEEPERAEGAVGRAVAARRAAGLL